MSHREDRMGRPPKISRDGLLDVAEEIVRSRGGGALTIGALAQAAGISKGGVQYSFASKDAIIRGLIGRWTSQFDALFEDGDHFMIGQMRGEVLHTPGHTPACLTYVIGDAAFVGDTLFMPDFGTARCDFPGGSSKQLFQSIQRILSLPDETRIFVGHDYKATGRDEYAWETTVGEQKALNIHIAEGKSIEEFTSMRDARDATLAMPRLILPSLQVNMRAGQMPEPDEDGDVFLKLPLNKL